MGARIRPVRSCSTAAAATSNRLQRFRDPHSPPSPSTRPIDRDPIRGQFCHPRRQAPLSIHIMSFMLSRAARPALRAGAAAAIPARYVRSHLSPAPDPPGHHGPLCRFAAIPMVLSRREGARRINKGDGRERCRGRPRSRRTEQRPGRETEAPRG